jgi:hypothetical protein
MANTYTQIYIHIVFAVQVRQNLIRRLWSPIRCRSSGADRNFVAIAIKILLLRSISCLRRRFKPPQAETENPACSWALPLRIGQTPGTCGAKARQVRSSFRIRNSSAGRYRR